MNAIYEPKGAAREYAELACNLYTGCNHGCLYCYAPGRRFMFKDSLRPYLNGRPALGYFALAAAKGSGSN